MGECEQRVHWSVTTGQEKSKRHRERQDQVAPPEGSCRWGDAADVGRGQPRGQQLLLEGEVVHVQVISEVWEGQTERRRRGDGDGDGGDGREIEGGGKEWKIWEKQEEGWRQLEQTLSQKLKNTCGMSVLLLHDVLHSCKNSVTLAEQENPSSTCNQMSHVIVADTC